MNTLYCDLCKKQIEALPMHDFAQSVNISGVGGDYYQKRFEVCDECKAIWNNEADIFINRVMRRCKGVFTRENFGGKIKTDWFPEEIARYERLKGTGGVPKKERNPTLQAIIDWLNKK